MQHQDWGSLTASGKDPNFPKSDEMDPPGTNSNKIFKVSSSLTVPKYLCKTEAMNLIGIVISMAVQFLKHSHPFSTQFHSFFLEYQNKKAKDHTHNNVWMREILKKLHFFLKLPNVSLLSINNQDTLNQYMPCFV